MNKAILWQGGQGVRASVSEKEQEGEKDRKIE